MNHIFKIISLLYHIFLKITSLLCDFPKIFWVWWLDYETHLLHHREGWFFDSFSQALVFGEPKESCFEVLVHTFLEIFAIFESHDETIFWDQLMELFLWARGLSLHALLKYLLAKVDQLIFYIHRLAMGFHRFFWCHTYNNWLRNIIYKCIFFSNEVNMLNC